MMSDDLVAVLHQQEIYGPAYYESHLGDLAYARHEAHWIKFFGNIADDIAVKLHPKSVFDAGCAHGFLLESLYDRGIRISGRDISKYALSQVRDDIKPFVEQGDIVDSINGEFDLVTCIEVLEHMPEREACRAIAAMTSATSQILFSSSPSDVTEPTHVNVKPIWWWLDRFAEAGFAPVVEYDASCVAAHAFLLRRSNVPIEADYLESFARRIARRIRFHKIKTRLKQRARIAVRYAKRFLLIGPKRAARPLSLAK